ncbi:MAG TPA: HYR domain-containing protein, partial [Phycisphaerae bacterium]|nr:HYR domain-containing protein [Phycisphaerae bacterium]
MNSRKTLYFVGLQLLCLSVLTATAGTDKPSASPAPGSAARVSTSDGIQARVPGETLAEHQALKECSLSKGPQKGSEGTGEKKILFEQEQPTGVQLWDGSATPDAGSCGTIPHGDVKRDMTSPLPPSLTLVADHSCYSVGQNVTVEIWMNDIEESIVAGQFFLHYDESKLQLISADPSGDPDGPFDPNNPFDTEVYECSMVAGAELPHCTQAPGLIDYAVGTRDQSPPFPGINGTVRMAVLTFTALQQVCDETDLITWRPHSPPTLLGSFDGEPVTPATINLSVADHVPPVLAGCPNDATVECDAVPPPAVPTATDNCDPAPQIAYHEVRTDGNCTDNYALTRTWTATDRCGNSSNCSQSITVRDTISPVLVGCPSSVTVECDAVPPPAAPTATDNCDPAPQIAYNEVLADGSCADDYVLTRTWTATDRCGNSSNCSQSITLHDTKPPQLSDCPGNQNVIPPAGSCEAEVTWTPPTVNDNCDPAPAVVYDIDLDDNSTIDETVAVPGYTFPGGVHRIIVRVTDRCGNVNDDCSFLVTVAATNQILVDVHMRGNSFSVPFTRCITFHLYNCTTLAMTPVQAVVTFDTFTPGIGAQAN